MASSRLDRESYLGGGIVASDVIGDSGRSSFRSLLKNHSAGDFAIPADDGHCRQRIRRETDP